MKPYTEAVLENLSTIVLEDKIDVHSSQTLLCQNDHAVTYSIFPSIKIQSVNHVFNYHLQRF